MAVSLIYKAVISAALRQRDSVIPSLHVHISTLFQVLSRPCQSSDTAGRAKAALPSGWCVPCLCSPTAGMGLSTTLQAPWMSPGAPSRVV